MALCLLLTGQYASAQQNFYNASEGSIRAQTSLTTGQIARATSSTDVGLSAPSDDVLLVGNGSTWQDKSLTDCDDTGGNHLNYDTATNAFSCGTSGGGGGSGDVTDVGPGCATGACLTDGVATTGSTLLVWEGTNVNTAEFQISVPSDPSSDITWTVPNSAATITFPSGTRTLATLDGTETLTNKSLDASSITSGTLGAGRGGTGIGSYAQGDLITATGTSTLTTIAKSTTATRYLANTGASNYAQWDTVNLANGVSGTLLAGNGGTGQTSTTDDSLLVANGSTFQLKTLADCDDSGGQHLNYDTTSNAFSCGTSGGAGGGAPADAEYIVATANGTLSNELVLTEGTMIDVANGAGLSSIAVDVSEAGNLSWHPGTDASRTWTINLSGTDPVWTYSSGVANLSTGTLQQGGTAVALQSRSISTTSPLSGGGDLSADRTLSITANGIGPTQVDETANYAWSGLNTQTSGSMNFGYNAGALILPNNTTGACDTATTEGQICWSTSDLLKVGTSSGVKTFVDTDSTQVLSNKSHDETSTSTALANVDNFSATITASPASASSSGFRGIYAQATSSSAQTVLGLIGVRGDGTWAGSASNTSGLVAGAQGFATKTSTGALGSLYGVYASVGNTNATGAVTNGYGVYIADSTTTGTITNDWALYTAGTEKSQFGGPVVYAAGSQAIAAAGNTFTCTTGYLKFTTATGTTVMTSNPTIADGTTGQVCRLENVDATGTDCVTFPDGTTGLQLGAARTLCPNDTLVVIYDGTDWVELSTANN